MECLRVHVKQVWSWGDNYWNWWQQHEVALYYFTSAYEIFHNKNLKIRTKNKNQLEVAPTSQGWDDLNNKKENDSNRPKQIKIHLNTHVYKKYKCKNLIGHL